jgi:hypothetical protein
MQFLHVLTAKNPAEKPHAIHRNQAYGLTPAEIAVMWQTARAGKSAPGPV